MKRRRRATYSCSNDDINFEIDLPTYKVDCEDNLEINDVSLSNIPIGKGKYKGGIDFEDGLNSYKSRVKMCKAALPIEETNVPTRVHKIGKKNKSVESKVEKLDSHIHSFKIDEKEIFTSKEKEGELGGHYHLLDGVKVFESGDASAHTHSVELSGKRYISSVPIGRSDNEKRDVEKRIVQREEDGQPVYCVLAESTDRSFGCYKTREEAEVRLRQIERYSERYSGKSIDKATPGNKLPEVLTWEGLAEFIPPLGKSYLPKSLEQDVPPRFRYWKCECIEESELVREALIESGLFSEETVREVNGELRRAVIETVEKLYLPPHYDDSDPVEIPPKVSPIEKVSMLLDEDDRDRRTVLFDEDIVDVIGLSSILEKANDLDGDYVIASKCLDEVRNLVSGPILKLKSNEDLVFITNAKVVESDLIEFVQLERVSEIVKYAFSEGRKIPLLKSSEEERIVYGIVLEPDEIDAQKDIISKEEIKQACHKFMEHYQNLGRQHQEIVNGKLKLLENFLAPVDFEVEGQKVKEGSWLMKERIVDDELWDSVKKEEYTGFSIGGSGIRVSVED
jgi:hypothetical protein